MSEVVLRIAPGAASALASFASALASTKVSNLSFRGCHLAAPGLLYLSKRNRRPRSRRVAFLDRPRLEILDCVSRFAPWLNFS